MKAKIRELLEEFRTVFAGRSNLADSAVPPVVFFLVNLLRGLDYAVWGSLLIAVLFVLYRLIRRQALRYALGGLGGVILAIVTARLLNKAEAFFLPGFITGILTVVICGVSVLVGRPLVAWTSHIVRRWPLGWYWHPRVRPAYSEVTIAWTVFFTLKLAVQLFVFQEARAVALTIVNTILGWPATVVLLALSYVYGLWRLGQLKGPSVAEFKAGAEPPWTGQRRGF